LSSLKQFFARPTRGIFILLGVAAFFLIFSAYQRNYSPAFGITKLLQVGWEFNDRGLAIYRTTPKYIDPASQWGFDGQFYAELALDPLLRDPQMATALDNPPYRARRILLPWLAWVGGLGRPFWILNVYTALNLIFWIGYAFLLGRLFRPYGWRGLAGWASLLMTCGIIESMQGSLADFPGFVLMTAGLMLEGVSGAGVLALAALAREPNIIGLLGLWDYRSPWLTTAKRNILLALIAGLPCALWFVYVTMRFPPVDNTLAGGNFSWPLVGIMAKLGEISVQAISGEIIWREWYTEFYTNYALHALLTIVATLTQCIYLLTHREWNNRIWRVGVIFVPYFLCINYFAWEEHFTVTRHALAITLAFNLMLALRPRRSWLIWFLLGNCFVPYGVYQFGLRDLVIIKAVSSTEYRSVGPAVAVRAVELQLARGWGDAEQTRQHKWRWATAQHATMIITNSGEQPLEVRLAFMARSLAPRNFKISVGGRSLWASNWLRRPRQIMTAPFLALPGDTTIELDTTGEPTSPGFEHDQRRLTFLVEDLQVILSLPKANP
jgi:hypothetical protein